MKILWILFLGHHKIGLYLGVISMHFGGGEWLLKFQTFFGVLGIFDIFGGDFGTYCILNEAVM